MIAIRPSRLALYFIDVRAQVPFRFGKETLERVTCARVMCEVEEASLRVLSRLGGVPPFRAMGMARRRAVTGTRGGVYDNFAVRCWRHGRRTTPGGTRWRSDMHSCARRCPSCWFRSMRGKARAAKCLTWRH